MKSVTNGEPSFGKVFPPRTLRVTVEVPKWNIVLDRAEVFCLFELVESVDACGVAGGYVMARKHHLEACSYIESFAILVRRMLHSVYDMRCCAGSTIQQR